MRCQFCGELIEGEARNTVSFILAKEHYNPTFFLRFKVDVKANGGVEKAKLCQKCLKELYTRLGKEFKED